MKNLKKKYLFFTSLSAIIILIFFISFLPGSSKHNSEKFIIKSDNYENNIVNSANKFLSTFSKEELEDVLFEFSDDERYNWDYVPKSREGIPINNLNENQQKIFKDLLQFSLSKQARDKVDGVLILENVLYELTGQSSFRDPGKYFITFFGKPDVSKPWGWRFEGHHLSLNFTIAGDSVIVSTPMFFGANPAEVKEGKHKGLRVLKNEEDFARELVTSFNQSELKETLIDTEVPSDIITKDDERIKPLTPKGISVKKMNKNQQEILLKLLKEYINNSNEQVGEQRMFDLLTSDLSTIDFAWAGSFKKGEPHYYRIQSNTFLVEYDNTQDNANHIHSVWRSFNNDFGEDLLKQHYINYHQSK